MPEHDDIARRIAQEVAALQKQKDAENEEVKMADSLRRWQIVRRKEEVEAQLSELAPKLRAQLDDKELEFLLHELWNSIGQTEVQSKTASKRLFSMPKILKREARKPFKVRKHYPQVLRQEQPNDSMVQFDLFCGSMELRSEDHIILIVFNKDLSLTVTIDYCERLFEMEEFKAAVIKCAAFYQVNGWVDLTQQLALRETRSIGW